VRAVPGGTDRAWRSARRYVAGEQIEDAIATAGRLAAVGLGASLDLFGERGSPEEAPVVAAAYEGLCGRLTDPTTWVSLDLSHIAFDAAALDRILAAVPPGRRLQIGAEEAATTDRVQSLGVAAARRGLPVELTLQANLRRSLGDAERLAAEGVSIRLVKGAYVERPADAHPWGPPTDNAYIALAHRLAADGVDIALATHDARLRSDLLRDLPDARCELLFGVLPHDATALAAAGHPVRIYVPFGPNWFRYLMRRRAESQGA
jgi:proline dehydrogenase